MRVCTLDVGDIVRVASKTIGARARNDSCRRAMLVERMCAREKLSRELQASITAHPKLSAIAINMFPSH